MLNKGDVVNIYQRPLTSEDFEGKARLTKLIRRWKTDDLERWYVEFEDEPGNTYQRNVCTNPHKYP